MNNFKVGVVDFFGILCPGIILLINFQVLLFACNIPIMQYLESMLNIESDTFFAIILFVLCYLFGFILRLISPDIVDYAATIFKKILNPFSFFKERKLYKSLGLLQIKNKQEKRRILNIYFNSLIDQGEKLPKFFWYEEKYPYFIGNRYIYKKYLSPNDAKIMDIEKYHNKNNYNYWKVLLSHNDINLAALVFQAEASVRFMAGSFWALLVGIISGILLIIKDMNSQSNLGYIISSVYFSLIFIILIRFKGQRYREVKILIDSIIVCKLNDLDINIKPHTPSSDPLDHLKE